MEDFENHLAKMTKPQPPPIDFTSKISYLTKIGGDVEILSSDDFQKIEETDNNKRYVISISIDLIFENYLELKNIVVEKKEINSQIVTEIY